MLYANETPEPSATSVSIFGDRFMIALAPLIKKERLMIRITPERTSSISAAAIGCSVIKRGSGAPHITYPIEIYISGTRRITEAASRLKTALFPLALSLLFIFGFVLSDAP